MVIENITRDHMMEMFMFLIGLVLAALMRDRQPTPGTPAT